MTRDFYIDTLRSRGVHFDPAAPSILVNDRRALLDVRSARAFALLAENFGERVTKDALLEAAWPNQLVHENSLAKAMSKLRQALDGSALEIAAAYGVGYILREKQGVHQDQPLRSTSPAFSFVNVRFNRESRSLAIASVALLMIVVAIISASIWPNLRISEASRRPITNDPPDAKTAVLWVDDHPSNNVLEVAWLRKRKIAVHLAENTGDALSLLRMNRYALVVSDLGRGEDRLAGLRMIRLMHERAMKTPVIIYTVRPRSPAGQVAQRRLVAEAGAADLAVTPNEVRTKLAVLLRFPLPVAPAS